MTPNLQQLWAEFLSTGADCLRIAFICGACVVIGLVVGYLLVRGHHATYHQNQPE